MSNEEVQPVEEVTPAVEAVVEEVHAVTEAPAVVEAPAVEEAPAPAVKPRKKNAEAVSGAGIVVSGADADDVLLSKCVFKNKAARKSLSVHHVQRKLASLGYNDAATDKDGWYGDNTLLAVAAYQKACGIAGDGLMNAATLESLFADESFINVIVD